MTFNLTLTKRTIYEQKKFNCAWKIDYEQPRLVERSKREQELRLPGRYIYNASFKDRNRYKAEHCRRMRELNGVGNKRKLGGTHAMRMKQLVTKWREAA